MTRTKTKSRKRKVSTPNYADTRRYTMKYGPLGAEFVERRKLGYRAAKTIRSSGRTLASGGSADYHIRYDLKTLREESQAMDRDNGLYRGLVNRAVDNILGENGFTLQARTSSPTANRQVEKLWNDEFCNQPEIRGLDDWFDCQKKELRHVIVDGDVGTIKTTEGQIQIIESERISYPSTKRNKNRVELGIELNGFGAPIFFHVSDYDDAGLVSSKPIPISAENFIFVANRDRISQTRGVPAMVSNFAMFHRINDVCDSEAISWQILSRLAVTVNRANAAELADITSTVDSEKTSPADLATRYHDIGEAIIFHAEPGEEIKGIERNIPGANFPESIRMFLRLIGLPLGLPLELVLLDWSNTNFSSARAALLQAYRMFGAWQKLLRRRFHTPIYQWKVRQWIEEKKIQDRDDILAHEWYTPPFPWVDPLKEMEADALMIDRGFKTFGEGLSGQNKDRETFITVRKQEIRDAIAAAKEINDESPDAKVPWQAFAGIVQSKTEKTNEQVEPEKQTNPVPSGAR